MITPSEIIYWNILPALRKQIVFELKELKLKQSEIAKILNLTPSAVSQYLNNKRGEFKFCDEFKEDIKKSALKISKQSSTFFAEINYLVKSFEKSKEFCTVCKDKNNFDGDCNVCKN